MIVNELEFGRRFTPLWWRIPAWTALTAYTVVAAPSLLSRILAGLAMGIGAAALQFSSVRHDRVRQVAVLLATVGGIAGSFASHDGIAEVLTAVTASRLPFAFEGRPLRVLVVADSLVFGLTVGYVSHTIPGLLAGLGIPLLVQRAVEQRELVRERDRAQALLVEAQSARDSEAQTAALRERGRIAREMHDVLAHSLAGLSVQLQAVRTIAAREKVPASVLEPLDTAADLARSGLAEARAAVGALRDPGGLGVDAIPALVERQPGSATFTAGGDPGEVSPAAGHAVYRAVQEALTNAARYAPGSAVSVTLAWRDGTLAARVADTGPRPGRLPVAGQGTGLGLAGMTERVGEAGGTVTAGPRDDGHTGWAVDIAVPATPAAVSR